MRLNEIGEFGFIKRFSEKHFQNLPKGYTGIGDDCAVIPNIGGHEYTVSTDMLIEDVHFVRSEIGGYLLGHKSLAVNLSDLAASGSTPCGAFLSIAVPGDVEVEFLDSFMDGFYKLSTVYGCPLLGGDTTGSRHGLAINVTVIGHCPEGRSKGRDKSLPGDIICVSGPLGDSAAGLRYILDPSLERNDNALKLIRRHHAPKPRILLGQQLGSISQVHSMMDISDGVASDIRHILQRSNVSAMIETTALPISPTLRETGLGSSTINELALCGGEDYELLFTVDPAFYTQEWANKMKITAIGRITAAPGQQVIYTENGISTNAFGGGYDHFAC
ncbi:MAG: thiamine-phosphate kinase [Bacteroidales bacterium]|nr:thiamine-phosphate kinase [Bacteroidales bacterium]